MDIAEPVPAITATLLFSKKKLRQCKGHQRRYYFCRAKRSLIQDASIHPCLLGHLPQLSRHTCDQQIVNTSYWEKITKITETDAAETTETIRK